MCQDPEVVRHVAEALRIDRHLLGKLAVRNSRDIAHGPESTIAAVDGEAAARAWVAGWTEGWESGDAEKIAALYTADAVFRSYPFREPEKSARDYARRAFADEELVECRFGEPVVAGDRAAVEYWAVLSAGGDEETLAGIALVRFGPGGKVRRAARLLVDGARPPPAELLEHVLRVLDRA